MGVRVINPVQAAPIPMGGGRMAVPNFEMYGPLGAGIASAGASIGDALAERGRSRERQEMFGEEMAFRREQLQSERSGLTEEIKARMEEARIRATAENDVAMKNALSNLGVAGITGLISLMSNMGSESRLARKDLLDHERYVGDRIADISLKLAAMEGGFTEAKVAEWTGQEKQILEELKALDVPGNLVQAMSIWGPKGRVFGIPGSSYVLGTGPQLPGDFEAKLASIVNGIKFAQVPDGVKTSWMVRLRNEMLAAVPATKGTSTLLTDREQEEQATQLVDQILEKYGLPKIGETIGAGLNYSKLARDVAMRDATGTSGGSSYQRLLKILDDSQTALGTDQAIRSGRLPKDAMTPDLQVLFSNVPRVVEEVRKYLDNPKADNLNGLVQELQSITSGVMREQTTARGLGTQTIATPSPEPPAVQFPTSFPGDLQDWGRVEEESAESWGSR